jgi:hypothetical protein
MARNVDKGGTKKIHPGGIVPHADGPTSTINDPAKFHGEGKRSGKTPSNGVEDHKLGPVFNTNSTHIPTMNADKPAKESKVIADHKGGAGSFKPTDTSGDLTSSQMGDGEPTNKPYPLKSSYDKVGQTESKKARNVF